MPEEKTVFGMLDDISASQSTILNEISGVKNKVVELEEQLKSKANQVQQNQTPKPQLNNKEILQIFLKKAKKSWRWFGTRSEFSKAKTLSILSLVLLLVIGLIATIITSISCDIYTTFTFFENVWMIFAIVCLTYASKTRLTYEVNELASHSFEKYRTDHLGMKFVEKEKTAFKVFRWLAVISSIANVIYIWIHKGNLCGLATVFEVLFLGVLIFAFFMNLNLFAQYSIIWVEGNNLTTNERVVLVLPPGAKQLMPEEEFKKKMPIFYQ